MADKKGEGMKRQTEEEKKIKRDLEVQEFIRAYQLK